MILVSIIIPYYKKKDFIEETINSIINQTYKNIEIIIVYDDQDNSDLEFLNKVIVKDKRIILVKNPKKKWAGAARNYGISISRGDYVAFIDSDDIWAKNKIETQLNFMKKNNYECSHTSYNILENDIIISTRIAKDFKDLDSLLKSFDIGLSTIMLKKNILTKELKFPDMKTKEDYVLWLKILDKGHSIFGIHQILVNWRKTKNSLSSSSIQKLKDGFDVYNKHMNFSFTKSLFFLICLSVNYLKKK